MKTPRGIASLRNPAVRRYRALRDPKERRALGLATAEGPKLLGEALAAGTDLAEVFVSERTRRLPGAADLLAQIDAGAAEGRWLCSTLPQELLEHMAFTEHPQGVLATFRPRSFALADAIAGDGPLLLLDRLSDPGNFGLIVRTAEAAGAAGIVASPGTTDYLNPKCIRASAGSIFRLPIARADLGEAVVAAKAAGFRLYASTPRGGAEYTGLGLAGRVGFLLGQEGGGLAPGLLDGLEKIRIPTGRVESLNVAMAAGILLFEALRQRRRG